MFFEMRFDRGTLDSGERSLPFGQLVGNAVAGPTRSVGCAARLVFRRLRIGSVLGPATYLS